MNNRARQAESDGDTPPVSSGLVLISAMPVNLGIASMGQYAVLAMIIVNLAMDLPTLNVEAAILGISYLTITHV